MTDTVKKVAEAIEAKRAELIAKPLARIWPELARAAISAMQEWRPIETAPDARDGSDVIVIGGRHQRATIVPTDGAWWRHAKSKGLLSIPTHWCPIPSPPEGE